MEAAERLPLRASCSYLVLHGFLLADQLGAQDQHLLLTHVQLLTGGAELLQEHLVGRRARSSGAGRRILQKTLPRLRQVVFQLLVLRLELLTLRRPSVGVRGAGLLTSHSDANAIRSLADLPSGTRTPAPHREPSLAPHHPEKKHKKDVKKERLKMREETPLSQKQR